ncbi:MAG: hypothetical protein KBF37_07165 [Saprospiraceae bacterium]|jgi:hypothetical protein|nr:hypothetical protein [Saprospiraceae bacterium]MBV6472929.1 hypothetical protein [Saprospiraceae bacterium]
MNTRLNSALLPALLSLSILSTDVESCQPADKTPYVRCGHPDTTVFLGTQASIDGFQKSLPEGCNCFLGKIQAAGTAHLDFRPLNFLRGLGHFKLFLYSGTDTLRGFEHLDTVYGDVQISSVKLAHLDAFQQLKSIGGYLFISRFARMERLDGFNQLRHVGNLVLSSNPDLKEIRGFSRLKEVTFALLVVTNPKLLDLDAFHSLRKNGGVISIRGNALMKDLAGFSSLQRTGLITIESNMALQRIAGFSCVDTMETLSIGDNASLRFVEGFGKLKRINYFGLIVRSNPLLEHINGFRSLDQIHNKILVEENPALTGCCCLYKGIQSASASTTITIGRNAAGCQSKEEVIARGPCKKTRS